MTDRMSIVTFPISRKLADDIDALPPDLKEKLSESALCATASRGPNVSS